MRTRSAVHRFGLIAACLLAAAALGWVAFQLQQQRALPGFLYPLLFPLMVGAAAGTSGGVLLRQASMPTWGKLFVAASGGAIAVAVQVLTGYQYYVAAVERQLSSHPMATLARGANEEFAPASLPRFLTTRIQGSGGWWFLDAALTVIASAVVCWLVLAKPTAAAPSNSSVAE